MKTYSLVLIAKKEVSHNTFEFVFEKPKKFSYLAGQYAVWTIPDLNPSDQKGNRRDFTISSSPFENFLSFTTRIRDTAFKNFVVKSKPGETIEMEGPYGDLFLEKLESRTVVFLAGGIGITPFKSIVTQLTHDKSNQKVVLFYTSRILEDAAYFEELKALEKENKNLKLIMLLTQPEKSKKVWTGEKGYITKNLLVKYLGENLNSYLYFAAGPPRMVDDMRNLLSKLRIKPENVLGENFGGY